MSKLQAMMRLVLTTQLSDRSVAEAVGVAKNTVSRYRKVCKAADKSWEELGKLTED